jgi:hypothetical protein
MLPHGRDDAISDDTPDRWPVESTSFNPSLPPRRDIVVHCVVTNSLDLIGLKLEPRAV